MSRNSKKIIPVIEKATTALRAGLPSGYNLSPRLNNSWLISWIGRVALNGTESQLEQAKKAIRELKLAEVENRITKEG